MTDTVSHDLESLRRAVRRGLHPTVLFFWGHTGSPTGELGKECFSQWYASPFELEGITYRTAEHYMMFQKSRLFRDEETGKRILEAPSPSAAKALGRAVRGFDGKIWEKNRLEIVAAGNVAKFGQHPALHAFLVSTRNKVLVEASPTDRIWGIGLSEDAPGADNPASWRGLNLLGFALMIARDRLAENNP